MSVQLRGLAWLNALTEEECTAELERVCGSTSWAAQMTGRRPFASLAALHAAADSVWWSLKAEDWKEAFTHHPRIGSRDALKEKFARTAAWASGEQSKVSAADELVIDALLSGNDEHEKLFGYIFIVCATGKSAEEMLAILRTRLGNDAASELRASACEENRITHLRLQKLITHPGGVSMAGPITTHVLDTARGRPAADLTIRLEVQTSDGHWKVIGTGNTDNDGRLKTLYPEGEKLQAATYRLTFETGSWFATQGDPVFFPFAQIVFTITNTQSHYHVPLLLSPFAYSTYRGS